MNDRDRADDAALKFVNENNVPFVTDSEQYRNLVTAILAYGEQVRGEQRELDEIAAVDAVMRHDVSFVNESLRRAIAKDVAAAIRANDQVTNEEKS